MKNTIIISFTLFLSIITIAGNDPKDNKSLKLADTYYSNGEYFKAIKYYKKAIKKSKFPTESYENMAASYLKTGNVKSAHKYYLKAERRKNAHREIEVIHAFALKRVGKYKNSKALLKHYLKVTKDSSVIPYIEDCDKALKWRKPNPKVKVAKIKGINSFNSDMAPYYYDGKIIFSSSREEVFILDKSASTGQPYYRLYSADMDGVNASNVEHYHYHEKRNHNISSLSFGDDENEVFYSTNQKIKKDTAKNLSPLKIYHSVLVDGKWNEGEIIISSDNDHINYAHPFYDSQTQTLYFSSNKDDGFGGMDIYFTKRSGNTWGEPINAGKTVNTDGDDVFPSYYGNTLYFSSDRRAGLGGYDIFSSQLLNNTFQASENMKMPINTNYDDFGFTFTDTTYTLGYFTSNRKGTKGFDDIFAFRVAPKNTKIIHLSGIAIDAVTGDHLKNATVKLTDDENSDLGSIETDDEGHYELELIAGKTYKVDGYSNGYFNVSENIETTEDKTEYENDLVFEKKGDLNITGIVIDDESKDAISDVNLSITITGKETFISKSESNGKFNKELKNQKIDRNLSFNIKFEKEGYISKSLDFNEKADDKGKIEVECKLHKLDIGVDIGKVADVQPIYFDVDKTEIRKDAALELDKVVQAMLDNPDIIIELGSHTDARGDDIYNLDLSERRANSSVNYIISKGITKNRLKAKGYGESQLVNDCGNNIECSDEQHQENRRTEFKIIKF